MADVAMWIAAAEPACPWQLGRFLEVYDSNRRGTVDAVLDGDILAATAEALAPWQGTATQLLEEVNKRASEDQKRDRHWFKRPRQVRDALKRLAPPLRENGIHITFGEKDKTRKRNRIIRLERTATASSGASASSGNGDSKTRLVGRSETESHESGEVASAEFIKVNGIADAGDAADASPQAHSDPRRNDYERATTDSEEPQR
jgi:hypothetical protein